MKRPPLGAVFFWHRPRITTLDYKTGVAFTAKPDKFFALLVVIGDCVMWSKILLIGMSHSIAIRNALKLEENITTTYLNFQRTPELLCAETDSVNFDLFPQEEPDLVLFSMGGNTHNVLGMFDHTIPFSIGHEIQGMVPQDLTRHFIPWDALVAVFDAKMVGMFNHADQIHAHYPNIPFIYISAPPPIGDEAHIRTNPSKFSRLMHLDFAPPALRVALFEAQSVAYAKQAARHGSTFLQPPPQALCPDGFLKAEYRVADPTHANVVYGRLVLDQLALLRGKSE